MFTIGYIAVLAALGFFGGKYAKKVIQRLKDDGYILSFKDNDTKGKILAILPLAIMAFVPYLHILTLAGSIAADKVPEADAFLYNFLKKELEITGVIVEGNGIDIPKATVKAKRKEQEEDFSFTDEKSNEPEIRTHRDAANYWISMQDHAVPTLPTTDELKKQEEELKVMKKTK